jgi:protein-S-isoprenylcysteine O-methyltransferase Ste14
MRIETMREETSTTSEGRFPPPVLYGAALVLGQVTQVCRRMPLTPPGFGPLRRLLGGALVAGGLATGIWGVLTMRRVGVSPDPSQPPPALVMDGPFQYSRNPLYVTMTAIYLGITVLRNNLWGVLLLPGLLAMVQRGAIEREEKFLRQRFGETYREYAERVPRWL